MLDFRCVFLFRSTVDHVCMSLRSIAEFLVGIEEGDAGVNEAASSIFGDLVLFLLAFPALGCNVVIEKV